MNLEIIALLLGAVISLMIFSYLLADNVLYRWALAVLVGSGVGYALGVAIRVFLVDWLYHALRVGDPLFYVVPLVLGCLLLMKWFHPNTLLGRLGNFGGNFSMAYLIGVGAAVAVSGALIGTLIPQVQATGAALTEGTFPLGLIQGLVIIVGTVATLLYFSPRSPYGEGRRGRILSGLQRVGRVFVVVALAVAFAGAVTSGLTVWIERLWDLAEVIRYFVGSMG